MTAVLVALASLGGCGRDESDQNIAIDNQAAAPADIEALPADESSATSSEELATGATNGPAEPDNQVNSY